MTSSPTARNLGQFPLATPRTPARISSIRAIGDSGDKAPLWRQVIWRIMRTRGVICYGMGNSHLNIGGGAIP